MTPELTVSAGDVLVRPDRQGWAALKILALDAWPDGTSLAHCLTYRPALNKPTLATLEQAAVQALHAPIDAASFERGWERIGRQMPSHEELAGFFEYLKLTDFPRYVSVTGQDANDIVRKANQHYKQAFELGEQGRRSEAIAEYDKAVDLFPLFHEAIDNRAFTHMDLGEFDEALRGFEQSLRVNPNGMTAFFSRGECLMKLGELQAAKAIFEEGQQRFPEQQALFAKFAERVDELRGRD